MNKVITYDIIQITDTEIKQNSKEGLESLIDCKCLIAKKGILKRIKELYEPSESQNDTQTPQG